MTYVDPGAVDTAFMTRAGMPGAPGSILATPEDVARKILLAIGRRPRELNAVPWQTAFVALGELFPRVTDFVVERNPALVGIGAPTEPVAIAGQAEPEKAPPALSLPFDKLRVTEAPDEAEAAIHVPEAERTNANGTTSFDAAIEPVRRRMERVKLSETFVRGLLAPDAVLEPDDVALRWAGMPNKNERAATVEVLDALTDAGFLARDGERYRVVRTAD